MNSPDKRTPHGSQLPPNRPAVPLDNGSADIALRELQLHQLELVAQNESLREAKQALSESCDRYAELFELAPVGYLTLDEQGIITAVNRAGEELLGIERATLVGRSFAGYVAADDIPGGDGIITLSECFGGDDKFGKRCTECNYRQTYRGRRYPEFPCKVLGTPDGKISSF